MACNNIYIYLYIFLYSQVVAAGATEEEGTGGGERYNNNDNNKNNIKCVLRLVFAAGLHNAKRIRHVIDCYNNGALLFGS